MDIVIGRGSLKQGISGKISGNICFEVREKFFPELQWNDFPITIMCWWIFNFLKGMKNSEEVLEFPFMDGPFLVLGKLENTGKFQMNLIRQNANCEVIFTDYIKPKEIQNMLIKACRKIFSEVAYQNIGGEVTTNLRALYDELKKLDLP